MPAVLPDRCLASAAAPTDDSVTSASRDTVSRRRLQVWSAASFVPQRLADLPQDLGDESLDRAHDVRRDSRDRNPSADETEKKGCIAAALRGMVGREWLEHSTYGLRVRWHPQDGASTALPAR